MVSTEGLVPITRAFLASYYDKYPFTPLSDDVSRLSQQIYAMATTDLLKDSPPAQGESSLIREAESEPPHKVDENMWKNREQIEEILFLLEAPHWPRALQQRSTVEDEELACVLGRLQDKFKSTLQTLESFQARNSEFVFNTVMTYMPQDFRGTIIRQQKERSERNKQAIIDALVSSGGSIHDKYALLWKQQMDRRKQLAELGSATGVYKTMMKYLVGVPEVLMDFVRQINDDQGPMEEQRQRYGPPLYSLTRMVYSIRLFLTLLWGRLETQKLQKDQISVLEEAANVYTSELERFIKFIGEVFTNSPFLITAEDAGALTARKNDEYKEISVTAGETHEQVKLVQDENMLLENILRTLLQELVSAAVESGEAIMQYGQSIVDEDARPGQIPRLLDIVLYLCEKEHVEGGMIFQLLEDLTEMSTMRNCKDVFGYIESKQDILGKPELFARGKFVMLRICNQLLRRLSKDIFRKPESQGPAADSFICCPSLIALDVESKPENWEVLSRSSLLLDLVAKGVMNCVTQEVKDLYHILEHEFLPIHLALQVQLLLTKISKLGGRLATASSVPEVQLSQYVPSLEKLAALRLLQRVSQVYQTMTIDNLSKLIPFFDFPMVEKISVDAVKNNFLAMKVDYRKGAIFFGNKDIFRKAILHPGPPQDFALLTVHRVIKPQKQVKLVEDENMLLENFLRTLLQELVSAAVESGEAIMQYGQSIVDEDACSGQIPRLLGEYCIASDGPVMLVLSFPFYYP